MHGAYDDVAACLALLDARWGGQWSASQPSPPATPAAAAAAPLLPPIPALAPLPCRQPPLEPVFPGAAPCMRPASQFDARPAAPLPAPSPALDGCQGGAPADGSPGRCARRLNYYLHLDCALGGLVLPFLRPCPPRGSNAAFPPAEAGDVADAAAAAEAGVGTHPFAAAAAAAQLAAVCGGRGPKARLACGQGNSGGSGAASAASACSGPCWQPLPRLSAAASAGHAAAALRRRRHWQHPLGVPLRDVQSMPCIPSGPAAAGPVPQRPRLPAAVSRAAPPPPPPPPVPQACVDGGEDAAGGRVGGMVVDFACPAVCSCTVSLHKQLGIGAVAAVFLSRAAFSTRLSVFQEVITSWAAGASKGGAAGGPGCSPAWSQGPLAR
jgi:hypothetical protein